MTTPGEPPIPLEVRLLGPLEVLNAGVRADLPHSKKTRALLAYLAASGRSHSRTHLCSLLWESTDDPRGALRWSLSKLRPFLDDGVERVDGEPARAGRGRGRGSRQTV